MVFSSCKLQRQPFLAALAFFWQLQGACAWLYSPAAEQTWFLPTVAHRDVYLKPFQTQQIQAASGLLTVVLPIEPDQQTLELLRIQLRTFVQHLNLSTIAEFLIVTPAEHKAELEAFFKEETLRELPTLRQDLYRVVDDGSCIPEANPNFEWYRDPASYWWNGWLTQQLLKLACAPLVTTPFYMLLDADVFAARPFAASDVFEVQPCDAGSAVCSKEGKQQLRAKNDCHQPYDGKNRQNVEWWTNTAESLQLEAPDVAAWNCTMGVTPQIFSTHIALQLGNYLMQRFQTCCWHGYLLDVADRHNWRRGDAGLSWSTAWTEYSLYFLFAFHSGLYDAFHVSISDSKKHILQDTAVWDASGYEKWDACRDTFQLGRGHLALVQSNIGIDPQQLWNQMSACMGTNGSSASIADASGEDLSQPLQGEAPHSLIPPDAGAAGLSNEAKDGALEVRQGHVGNTADHKPITSQLSLIAEHSADGGTALSRTGLPNLVQALLAEDHNGALLHGDSQPPLLLMRTKVQNPSSQQGLLPEGVLDAGPFAKVPDQKLPAGAVALRVGQDKH
ncbi:hypothetical protein WJX74_002597 [Apatococcus lobatus]|uniref:Nucleotide-diphospho-sugar transferase domain-containing protein n=1 Tax=Apatococcus lobatus TaxID=904363 RepID=A0AAW1RF31_9CHLO